MCRVPVRLRELVKQKLDAAAEEIFELLERTIAEYEEETERQRRLLETLLQPRVLLHTAGCPRSGRGPLSVGPPKWTPSLDPGPEKAPRVKEEEQQQQQQQDSRDLITSHTWKKEEDDPEAPPAGLSVSVKTEDNKPHTENIYSQTEPFYSENQDLDLDLDQDLDLDPHSSSQLHRESRTSLSGLSVSVKTEDNKPHTENIYSQTEPFYSENQDLDLDQDLAPHSSSQLHRESRTGQQVALWETAHSFSDFPAYVSLPASEPLPSPLPLPLPPPPPPPPPRRIRHTCPFCGKAFVKTDNFKCHLRTHTGEKPFSCSVCGKRFAYHASFNNHRQIHSGEKPFRCPVCGKDFTLKIGLRQHMFTHDEEKPFTCSICGKGFCVKQGLTKHMRQHGTEPDDFL